MKPRSYSAQKASQYSQSLQKKRYQRVQTEYGALNRNDSFNISKDMKGYNRKGKSQLRSSTKEPQKIIEENLNLKSFINNLQSQLSLQRGRLQASKRKTLKYTKQLSRQFQKQLYYSGKAPNAYVISGIKNQYQNMKAKYQQKCIQMNLYIQMVENTHVEELKAENQALHEQNIFLRTNLQAYLNIKEELAINQRPSGSNNKHYRQNSRLYSQPSEDKSQSSNRNTEILAFLYAQEKENMKRATQKIASQTKRLQSMAQKQQQYLRKIEFLEKLVIQKDNNEHSSRREFKRVQKQKLSFQNEIAKLKELIDSKQNSFEQKFERLRMKQKQKFEMQRQIFENCLRQKNDMIQKLQKEIRFLSTMLSYWKPLDEINRQFKKQSEKESSQSDHKKQDKSIQREDKAQGSCRFRLNSEHAHESQVSEIDLIRKTNHNQSSLRINRQDEFIFKRNNTDNRSSNNALLTSNDKPLKSRLDCSVKHSDKAKKVRKVDPNQIKKYGQLLRYRLLGHQINMQKVKAYFADTNSIASSEQQPSSNYITMRQIKTILQQSPFMLKQNQAILVSRYIVQDSNNEYVYWDEDNEIDRNIAKSILKAFIGEYRLPAEEQVVAEWAKIKKIYLENIIKALKSIAPKGQVTLYKFNELITGLGIEMSEHIHEWLISQIVIKSSSLDELKYDIIIDM